MATAAAGAALQLRTAQWPCVQLALPRIGGVGQSMVVGSRTPQQRGAVRCSNSHAPAADDKVNAIHAEEELELLKTEAPRPHLPAPPAAAAPESAASAFLSDVANLIKLVDSRDIVELELKHLDYELLIRKKEALPPAPAPVPQPQASFPGPHIMGHTPYPYGPPPPPPAAEVSRPAEQTVNAAPAEAPAAKPPSPSLPAMLSPMAGTFYRSPGPGEPPFVKVGDKIQKGQVICIVEAMKLMNEIEADQSGTLIEIIAEDRKPVSIESPLFLIKS